jgi:hypothetical protein
MKRRSALKNLGLTLGGLVSLPAWATGWTPQSLGTQSVLTASDEQLLAEMVEAIIPATTHPTQPSPGAKELGVHKFAIRMIHDCYGEAALATLEKGLIATEATAKQLYAKSFMELPQSERLSVLTALSQAPESKPFIQLIKNLTIQGFTNSEYYLTNIAGYVMAPGFYHGCVPVS